MKSKTIIAETERLILRRYQKEDLQDLFEYLSDKEVVEYEPYRPLTLNETKENLEWRIGTDEMIAVESCKVLIQQAFLNSVHRIYAECDPRNKSSWKLLEVLGFQREAHLRKNIYFWKDENGKAIWKDTYIYAKLNVDK